MITSLTKTEKMLFNRLRTGEVCSAQFLANTIGISSKTVRNTLSGMTDLLEPYGIHIIAMIGIGYQMTWDSLEQLNYVQSVLDMEEVHRPNMDRIRAHLLVRHLLSCDSYVEFDDIAELLHMSNTMVKKYIRVAKDFLADFDLEIETRRSKGMRISGKEHDIRMAINFEYEMFVRDNVFFNDEEFAFAYELNHAQYKQIVLLLQDLDRNGSNFNFSEYSINFIARLIYISALRNENGHTLEEYDAETIGVYTDRHTYIYARRILHQCETLLNATFSMEDEILLGIVLVALRVCLHAEDMFGKSYIQYRNVAYDLANYLAQINYLPFIQEDAELIDDLALRMEMFHTKGKYHIRTNQFGKGVSLSLMARKLAIQSEEYLSSHLVIANDRDSIPLLGMTISPVFKRYRMRRNKLRICCISELDKRFGNIMASELMEKLGEYIDHVDVYEKYELTEEILAGYDALVTTCDVRDLDWIPDYIHVFSFSEFYRSFSHKCG